MGDKMSSANEAVFVLNAILIVFSVVFLVFLIFCTCWFKCNKRHRKALIKEQRDRELQQQQSMPGQNPLPCTDAPPNYTQAVQFTAAAKEYDNSSNYVEEEIVDTSGIKVKLISK